MIFGSIGSLAALVAYSIFVPIFTIETLFIRIPLYDFDWEHCYNVLLGLLYCIMVPLAEGFFYRFFHKLHWHGCFANILLSLSCALTAYAFSLWMFNQIEVQLGLAALTFVVQFILFKIKDTGALIVSLLTRIGIAFGSFAWYLLIQYAYRHGLGLTNPRGFSTGDRDNMWISNTVSIDHNPTPY